MKVKTNPNFGRWSSVSSNGSSPTPTPTPNNFLTEINNQNEEFNKKYGNVSSVIGYSGCLNYQVAALNTTGNQSFMDFPLPDFVTDVTSVTLSLSNTTSDMLFLYIYEPNSATQPSISYQEESESISSLSLDSFLFTIKNNILTVSYSCGPMSGPVKCGALINYIVKP